MSKVKRSKLFSVGYDFEARVHVNQVIGRFRIEKLFGEKESSKGYVWP